ncbi:MAG: apolipoprotein N-acyltransferase [Pseudomonadota bacterium]|nr:apolipoprotein N-acyltransferase [Pseudomonadota bacterium]
MWLSKLQENWSHQPRWARIGAPFLLGMIGSLGQAPFGLPLLSLIGFGAAFALLTAAQNTRAAVLNGWLFGLGYFIVTLQWLVSPFLVDAGQTGWMAPFGVFFMSAGLSLFWALAFGVAKRVGEASLVVTLAIAELARAYVLTGLPWGMPAYGLVDSILGQGAAFLGPHGLNVIFFALAFWMFQLLAQPKPIFRPAGFVLVFGVALFWPLPKQQGEVETVGTIRLVQPNAPQHQKWDPDYMPIIFDRALELTAQPGDVDLIIWPETSLPAALPGGATELAQITEAANGTPIVFGANRFEIVRLFNSAVLMDEMGQITQTYDKHHLVPFGEYMPLGEFITQFGYYGLAASEGRGFSRGSGAEVMDLGSMGLALPLICYEAVFPQDVGASKSRPDFLMQITNDAWFGTFSGPYQQLAQSRMRSIEQGLPMVRAANTGISALIDAKGRVVEALPLNEAGFLDVDLPKPSGTTLYSSTGDLPVSLILCCGLFALWLRNRRNTI